MRTWRQARATCQPDCFGQHATRPLLRRLGVVPSPRWHADWYSQLIAETASARGTLWGVAEDVLGDGLRWREIRGTRDAERISRPLAILVVNPDDHLLPAILTALAPPAPVELHVLSPCLTPLRLVERWATRHGQTVTVHHGALARKAGPFDLCVVADDSIDLGLTHDERRVSLRALFPVVDALAPGARLAYATRLGPNGRMRHRHEYTCLVRLAQTLAGLTWRHRPPNRWQVTAARWRQRTRDHPYYMSVVVEDILTRAGLDDVNYQLNIHERPSRLLRWHPTEIALGAGSQTYRFTGTAPPPWR